MTKRLRAAPVQPIAVGGPRATIDAGFGAASWGVDGQHADDLAVAAARSMQHVERAPHCSAGHDGDRHA